MNYIDWNECFNLNSIKNYVNLTCEYFMSSTRLEFFVFPTKSIKDKQQFDKKQMTKGLLISSAKKKELQSMYKVSKDPVFKAYLRKHT